MTTKQQYRIWEQLLRRYARQHLYREDLLEALRTKYSPRFARMDGDGREACINSLAGCIWGKGDN